MGWIADLLEQIPSAAAYKVQLEKLDSEHKILQAENRDLKAKLETANREIDKLKQQSEENRTGSRSEAETKVLLSLAKFRNPVAAQIADDLGMSLPVAEMHLEELRRIGFVGGAYNMYAPTRWFLEHLGSRYLYDRNLLK